MSRKRKSVLEADRQTKPLTADAVGGYVEQKQVPVVAQPVLMQADQAAYSKTGEGRSTDPYESENITEKREKSDELTRAEYEAQKAEQEAYRGIVREAYEDYRRNKQLFPEYMSELHSGQYDDLLTHNDLIFQEYVREAAQKVGKKNKRLEKQLDALIQEAVIPNEA